MSRFNTTYFDEVLKRLVKGDVEEQELDDVLKIATTEEAQQLFLSAVKNQIQRLEEAKKSGGENEQKK